MNLPLSIVHLNWRERTIVFRDAVSLCTILTFLKQTHFTRLLFSRLNIEVSSKLKTNITERIIGGGGEKSEIFTRITQALLTV